MKDIAELFHIADEETKAGNGKQAIRAYTNIIKLSAPDSKALHLAHWGIGEIHLNNKQYDKAESHLKKALALSPDEPTYHYLLGCTYRYTNDVESSIHHLRSAVGLDDSVEIYWAELGCMVGHKRDTDEGIGYLKKALAINPASSKSLRDICVLYVKMRKWGEALVCIEEAVKRDADNPEILGIKADVELFKSEFERLSAEEA